MAEPYTIRIFVPDGDPEGLRLVDRMNWTGLGLVFRRSDWSEVRKRREMQGIGIYILVGYRNEDDGLVTVHVGQAGEIRGHIDSHQQSKDFWDWAVAFVSTSGGLNRAHAKWLEYALIERATHARRCQLDNDSALGEPEMTDAEKADSQGFMKELLQILPLVGLKAFELPNEAVAPQAIDARTADTRSRHEPDTVIVSAREDTFQEMFLDQDCWCCIRISDGMLGKIKYITAYRTNPVSAITHYAPVSHIEPYGKNGKYKLLFSESAKPIGPIPYGDAPRGLMQGPRYTSFRSLQNARKLTDVIGRS